MKKSRGLRRATVLLALLVVVAGLATVLAACGTKTTDQDVVTAAGSNDELSQWVDAVKSAGLDSTLAGTGPFTVFASSNDAITAAGSAPSADVLKAMIIEGSSLSKDDLAKGTKNASMLAGNDVVTYTGKDGSLYMNSMKVIGDPIEAKNGIIYEVDGVVTPK